jgi:hypothetical protein
MARTFSLRGGRLVDAVGHGMLGESFALCVGQPGDAVRHAPADGDLFEDGAVAAVKFEPFHGGLTGLGGIWGKSSGAMFSQSRIPRCLRENAVKTHEMPVKIRESIDGFH